MYVSIFYLSISFTPYLSLSEHKLCLNVFEWKPNLFDRPRKLLLRGNYCFYKKTVLVQRNCNFRLCLYKETIVSRETGDTRKLLFPQGNHYSTRKL